MAPLPRRSEIRRAGAPPPVGSSSLRHDRRRASRDAAMVASHPRDGAGAAGDVVRPPLRRRGAPPSWQGTGRASSGLPGQRLRSSQVGLASSGKASVASPSLQRQPAPSSACQPRASASGCSGQPARRAACSATPSRRVSPNSASCSAGTKLFERRVTARIPAGSRARSRVLSPLVGTGPRAVCSARSGASVSRQPSPAARAARSARMSGTCSRSGAAPRAAQTASAAGSGAAVRSGCSGRGPG